MRPVTNAPPHPIAARFAQIIAGLRLAIGMACCPPLAAPVVYQPRRPLPDHLATRLYGRLGRMIQDFAALVAHVIAFGTDAPSRPPRRKRAPRPAAAAPDATRDPSEDPSRDRAYWIAAAAAAVAADAAGAARPEPPPRAPRPRRLPGNFGWLLGMSTATAIAGSQLAHLLTDPEVLALLRASPHLVKMLRPLCRMLGVTLPAEFRPRPPPPDADAEPKPPRRRRRRLWRPPSRRSDMLSLARMGAPLIRA